MLPGYRYRPDTLRPSALHVEHESQAAALAHEVLVGRTLPGAAPIQFSPYFIENWMRTLGPTWTALILELRYLAFAHPNPCPTGQELAAALGISRDAITKMIAFWHADPAGMEPREAARWHGVRAYIPSLSQERSNAPWRFTVLIGDVVHVAQRAEYARMLHLNPTLDLRPAGIEDQTVPPAPDPAPPAPRRPQQQRHSSAHRDPAANYQTHASRNCGGELRRQTPPASVAPPLPPLSPPAPPLTPPISPPPDPLPRGAGANPQAAIGGGGASPAGKDPSPDEAAAALMAAGISEGDAWRLVRLSPSAPARAITWARQWRSFTAAKDAAGAPVKSAYGWLQKHMRGLCACHSPSCDEQDEARAWAQSQTAGLRPYTRPPSAPRQPVPEQYREAWAAFQSAAAQVSALGDALLADARPVDLAPDPHQPARQLLIVDPGGRAIADLIRRRLPAIQAHLPHLAVQLAPQP